MLVGRGWSDRAYGSESRAPEADGLAAVERGAHLHEAKVMGDRVGPALAVDVLLRMRPSWSGGQGGYIAR
jgi:hypothetical protein